MNHLVVDIDGTLLTGNTLIPQAKSFLESLIINGTRFLLATNSIKPVYQQLSRFRDLGFDLDEGHFYSPIHSINRWLKQEGITNALVIGPQLLIDQIEAHQSSLGPQVVILLDFEQENVSYQMLQLIIDTVEKGTPIISASASPFYLKEGRKQIDTGGFVRLIESVVDRRIPILGKPSQEYFLGASEMLGVPAKEITVIGDDWKTDIKGANACDFNSILVKTGKYQDGDENKGNPDRFVQNLGELLE